VISVLEASIGYRYGAVLLIDDDGERLEPFALSDQGLGGAFVETDKAYVSSRGIRVGHGITGWVARHGMAVRAGNVLEDPRYVPMRDDIRSELCVPIRVGERILGVINIETTEPDAYSEVDQQTLEIVAAQVGLALEMRRLAGVDSLTGAANRRVFDEALPRELRRGARDNRPVSLLMIDIDHFKDYNDACGHLGGDRCLQDVVAVLARGVSRAGEVLARYGGEEFAVILPNADSAAACAAAERLRASIERAAIPHPSSRTAPFVTASIGVATAPAGDGTPESLLGSADAALYAAKALGRNRVAAADARVAYCQEPSEKPMP
jgi:diguanylate cyclase (GGDEF)-like protein